MPRFAVKIQYDGTNYVGYQVQPNGPSIQAEFEKALVLMAKLPKGEHIPTASSGRTDSGVHALGQVLHFDYPVAIKTESMLRALNSIELLLTLKDFIHPAEVYATGETPFLAFFTTKSNLP